MCTTTGSAPAPARPSPGAVAAMLWQERVHLEKPGVWMAPGKAITGLAGCLEIGGEQSLTRSFPGVMGYDITLSANSTYDIDWGDGTWTRGVSGQGGPCEGGNLRHTYQYKGSATIVVHQHWTATWSSGDASGSIAGALETSGSLSIPIFEVQAVVDG